jgi:Zn-dependent peptidase ImmA (M78 family)/transcriptional regulator with XRE-family HTH domain
VVTRVPIDPATARWARERCHLTVEAASGLLKCTPAALRKIEQGEVQPSATLFRSMAERYLLPEATLLGLAPAIDRPLPEDFRSFDGVPIQLSYETIKAIRLVQGRQEALARLAEIDDRLTPPVLPYLHLTNDPELEGRKFRETFGFDVQTQLRLPDAYVPWRTKVEQLGVAVYVEPLGEDDSRGFSLNFNDFPAVVIDQREKMNGARLFTLFHELAHVFLRQVGISDMRAGSAVERFCNRFAAAFLMPPAAIAAVMPGRKAGDAVPTIPELDTAARRLSVTISQMALRMEDLGLAGAGYFKGIVSQLQKPTPAPKKKDGDTQVPYRYTYLSRYGERLAHGVLDALDAGLISTVEAARVLHASPDHFEGFRETLKQRQVQPPNAA